MTSCNVLYDHFGPLRSDCATSHMQANEVNVVLHHPHLQAGYRASENRGDHLHS